MDEIRVGTVNTYDSSETFYKSIVELSPDAITVASIDMTIVDVNEKAQSLFGCSHKLDAVGRALEEFIEPSDYPHLCSQMAAPLSTGIALNIETTMRRCDGSHFHAEISAKIINPQPSGQPILLFLTRDISERKLMEQTLRNLAITDPLTRLYNRRGLSLASEKVFDSVPHQDTPLAVLFMDIDNMKSINDRHGHECGDQALRLVADCLRGSFDDNDIVARWGGDEFVVLVVAPDQNTVEDAVQRFNAYLAQQSKTLGCQCPLSVTTGISIALLDSPKDLEAMIKRADTMMYLNKRRQRE